MVEKIGQRIVYLFPGAVSKEISGQRASRSVVFEEEDIVRVEGLHSVDRAGANLWLGAKIFRAQQRSKLIWTYGGDENTGAIRNFEIESGRLINRRDVLERREVVFLGHTAAHRILKSSLLMIPRLYYILSDLQAARPLEGGIK